MSEIWILFLVVFVATVVIMTLRDALGRKNLGRAGPVSGIQVLAAPIPPRPARVLLWLWCVGFVVGMLATEWMASTMRLPLPQDQIHAVAMLIHATWLLVWGLLPAAVIRSLGSQRFNAFKAVVAYNMRGSFRSGVLVWLIGVIVLAGLGAWGLAD
jgi:hypothetical protein